MLKDALDKIKEGFLSRIGIAIFEIILFVIYLFLKNIKGIKEIINSIPSHYLLTLIIVLALYILYLNIIAFRRNRIFKNLERQSRLREEPEDRLITHFGVWWKINDTIEWIEDFPYCSCCEPKNKLIQREGFPNELYHCWKTKTEYKVYGEGGIPITREQALKGLRYSYFEKPKDEVRNEVEEEFAGIKKDNPSLSDESILRKLLEKPPFTILTKEQRDKMISKYNTVEKLGKFVAENIKYYQLKYDKQDKKR